MEALLLPIVKTTCLHPQTNTISDADTTTSALQQLTSNIATGFNQRKPPHRTVCVAVHPTEAFDTVNHNVLLSKIVRLTLPETTCRWMSNFIRGRQSVTSCRGVKSKTRIVHWRTTRLLIDVTNVIQFYLSDVTADRTSQADLLHGRHNRTDFESQDSGTGAHDQRLPDRDVLFHTR